MVCPECGFPLKRIFVSATVIETSVSGEVTSIQQTIDIEFGDCPYCEEEITQLLRLSRRT